MLARRSLAPFALAGIVGPLCFAILVIVQGTLIPEYSHVRQPISALAAYPTGWLQRLNFYQAGVLLAVFTIGLHLAVRATRFGIVSIVLLLLAAVGMIGAGLFSWIMVDGAPTETTAHVVPSVMVFAGEGLGLIALSRRLRADASWRGLAAYTLVTGAAVLVSFVAVGVLGIPDDAPLHPWVGVLQRVIVALWFACTITLAARMWRLAPRAAADAPSVNSP
jgi:hypothetical membrane protein